MSDLKIVREDCADSLELFEHVSVFGESVVTVSVTQETEDDHFNAAMTLDYDEVEELNARLSKWLEANSSK